MFVEAEFLNHSWCINLAEKCNFLIVRGSKQIKGFYKVVEIIYFLKYTVSYWLSEDVVAQEWLSSFVRCHRGDAHVTCASRSVELGITSNTEYIIIYYKSLSVFCHRMSQIICSPIVAKPERCQADTSIVGIYPVKPRVWYVHWSKSDMCRRVLYGVWISWWFVTLRQLLSTALEHLASQAN